MFVLLCCDLFPSLVDLVKLLAFGGVESLAFSAFTLCKAGGGVCVFADDIIKRANKALVALFVFRRVLVLPGLAKVLYLVIRVFDALLRMGKVFC